MHKNYSKRLLRKFRGLDNRGGVGITLTLRCLGHHSVYRDLEKIKKCWNVLRLALGREYEGWKGNYFSIVEVGKENYMVHLHVILYGLWNVDHEWLKRKWHEITGDSYVVWCSNPDYPKRATDYIWKYLAKSVKESEKPPDGMLMVWASGLRLWGCSRGLFAWLNIFTSVLEDGWNWSVYLTSCSLEGYYEVKKADHG